MVYRFVVPGRPVPKGRPRVTGRVTYTPRRTKAQERRIWVAACQAGVRPIVGPVELRCTFHMASIGRSDVDNLAKTVLDALNGTAYRDDRQVVMLVAVKVEDREERTEVLVGGMGALG